MIIRGKFQNIYGIKDLEIDFRQKYANDKEQEDQIIKSDNVNVSLTPTILAKNAKCKTSLIKAIDFTLRFSNKETFVQYVSNLKCQILVKEIFSKEEETDEISTIISNIKSNIFKELFDEISFAGSSDLLVELETINNGIIKIEAGVDYFTISINDEKIDLISFIDDISLNSDENTSRMNLKSSVIDQVKEKSKNIKFIFNHRNYSSIFRDTRPITEINEINVKYKTKKYINNIINKLGFEALDILLRKLDNNISSISFDLESKGFNIFIKNSDVPIAPRNLSFGTQKVLEILNNSLYLFENGGIVMIDEIENGLHISLIKLIVSLFEDPEINKASAQLLLTTHLPLLGEHNIINTWNIFIEENNSFVQLRDLSSRTYDQEKIIKSKNYYNDFFWLKQDTNKKSTLSHLAIDQIITEFHKGVKFGK